ncbi:MAG TPA: CHRD domain-containing protein [Thermoanaerobaculaceae bacterium]|nr:CHRD domain-containing protein [Thermoanaerobaculaceae bacterium]
MRKLLGVLVVAILLGGGVVEGQTFTATLAGSREAGGGDPAGRGLAVITVSGGSVYYFLWVQGIASPGAAHIHAAAEGVSGSVVVGLTPTWTTVATGTYMAMGSVAADGGTTGPIVADPAGYYVNVHNAAFPDGAVRGQLLGDGPASFALATTLRGSREPAGGSSTGEGFAALVFDASGVDYYLWETGLSAPTAAHVHTGGAGVSGPVLVGLSPTFAGGQAMGSVAVDGATLAAIQASPELYYVNIHTGDFPNGAIRGQLGATETDVSFAVAAHNAGLGTSFFRTDVRALSLTDEAATVYAEWYPHGVSGATGPGTTAQFVIPAGGEAVYDDVVSSLFGTSNRGAIRLMSAYPFKAIARNYNDQRAAGSGTFGQDEPGLGVEGALTSGALMLNSNRPKSDGVGFRTNVGYFNPSPYAIDVTFNVRTPDGTLVGTPSKVTFPAWDDEQALFYQIIPGIPSDQQSLANFFVTFTATHPIYVFSSPVDNVTDDGMHQPAVKVPAALTQPVSSAQGLTPTGTITAPAGSTTVAQGTTVAFQGTGTDPRGEALAVYWEFGDGSSGSGYETSHAYSAAGTFTATMTVTDTDGLSDSNPPTRTITVTQAQQSGPPTGTITTPPGNTSAYTGYVVDFVGTGTDPKGESLSGTWEFGDGATAIGLSVSHTFAAAGVYTVTFTVKNADGVSDPHPPSVRVSVTDYTYGY